jgi:hypothetical protein
MYHFSAPSEVSRNPSDELSDPLLPLLCSGVKAPVPGEPGDREYGEVECWREVWKWLACMATDVAPVVGPALVVSVLACVPAFDVVEVFVFAVELFWVYAD